MTSLSELFDLRGRVAVVTGGSRGLGLQMAEALGEYGAKVFLGPGAVQRLRGRILDAVTERGGRVQFVLRKRS